jgi:hypothetical protein
MGIKTTSPQKEAERIAWEEESGLLNFLSTVNAEVARFDDTFDFGVSILPRQPQRIDGSADRLKRVGFVVVRRNSALTGRDYCLFSLLQGKALYGYIGVYSGESIETVRELGHITDFRNAAAPLLGWLRQLVKASCEKI